MKELIACGGPWASVQCLANGAHIPALLVQQGRSLHGEVFLLEKSHQFVRGVPIEANVIFHRNSADTVKSILACVEQNFILRPLAIELQEVAHLDCATIE